MGNAAEMALRLKQYRRAYNFALGAVTATQDAHVVDAVLLEKNKRRLGLAKGGTSCYSSATLVLYYSNYCTLPFT